MSENASAQEVNGQNEPASLGSLAAAADLWKRLPRKSLFFILFAAFVALFHWFGNATIGYGNIPSLFIWAREIYLYRPDDAHGMYIPLAVIFFFWLKRSELSETRSAIWPPAIGYLAFALALHFIGYRVQQARVSMLAFIFGLHALIGVVWGREALRRTIFPVFLLLFCIPFGVLADPLTFKLRMLVTRFSVAIGHDVLGIQIMRDGSQIVGPAGRALYDVAPACSGLRSLVAMAALSVIYAFLNLNVPWHRVILIAFALPMALFSNIVRVTTVIVVGDTFGPNVAAAIEQKFGFITFAVALAGMMLLGFILSERKGVTPLKTSEMLEAKPS